MSKNDSRRLFCIGHASRLFLVVAVPLAFAASPADAQIRGVRFEAGPVFLTKSGRLPIAPRAIESDAGYALRGRLRGGLGPISLSADAQTSSQKYPASAPSPAPTKLNASFVGVTAALHPFELLGLTPYAEVGYGKLFFSDQRILGGSGIKATSYGLGVIFAGSHRVSLDVELRLMRQTGLRISGLTQEFKYQPKMFSAMLSIQL